jgi:flavin reductase (DIM6/NTAB) family NADH-FMN oxidoreductase RutF
MTIGATVHEVMEEMPYGLYIVGSRRGDDADGMMADWVMQVSFSPRLVAVAFENDARTLENIRESGVFSINLLAQDERSMALAAKFAQPYYDAKIRGRDAHMPRIHHKLDEVAYSDSARGAPILDDAMAWLECRADTFVPVGDHTLVVGSVCDGELRREAEPLTSTYTGWNYAG